MIGCKHPNINLCFFRFGITSLDTVVFGRFLRPKKCHFWPKTWIFCTFFKSDNFLKHSILIICHGCQFSFYKLFFNVSQYTLSAISVPPNLTPIDVLFFGFSLCYLEKTNNIAVVNNVPDKVFFPSLFPSLTRLAVFCHFPRQK